MQPAWESDFLSVLKNVFQARREEDPSYSMRRFAQQVGLSIGGLSKVMSAHLPLSRERAAEVLKRLNLPTDERDRLLAIMGEAPEVRRTYLPADDYEFLTDPAFIAIWVACDLDLPRKDPAAMAERFGLSLERATAIMQTLKERGLIVETENGWVRGTGRWKTSDGIPSTVIAEHHRVCVRQAQSALSEVAVAERDFTSTTFAGNRDQIEFVRSEIRKLHERVSAVVGGVKPKDEVFRLSVQFYPIRSTQDGEP